MSLLIYTEAVLFDHNCQIAIDVNLLEQAQAKNLSDETCIVTMRDGSTIYALEPLLSFADKVNAACNWARSKSRLVIGSRK
jgi:hypothetical protein